MMELFANTQNSTRYRSLKTVICILSCCFIYLLCHFTPAAAAGPSSYAEAYWLAFRHQNPLFIQDVVLTSPTSKGERLLLLSEPPPLLFGQIEESLAESFGDAYKGYDIFTQKVGFDGWVKDIVVRLSYPENTRRNLEQDIATLHQKIFGTDYKAGYRLFDPKPWTHSTTLKRRKGAPPDLRISANSINDWFFGNPVKLMERTAGTTGFRSWSDTPVTLEEAFDAARPGVYYSVKPGLVVLLIDRSRKLNASKACLRQFLLDTDAIVGAIGLADVRSGTFAIIGRERDTSISAMPPLRGETVLTLAATKEEDLAQSYERTLPLAEKTTNQELVTFVGVEEDHAVKSFFSRLMYPQTMSASLNDTQNEELNSLLAFFGYGPSGVDWAPIFLSHDLMHTEYGNLLNVTDQILKGWSESNQVKYGNFPYRAPSEYPYIKGVFNHLAAYLQDSPLTYNWNTAGFGSWVPFGEYKIFALHRTGALPVSYIVDSVDFASDADTESAFLEAEDAYWQFFAGLRDPNLNRAAQYAALHVIFRTYSVFAEREDYKISEQEFNERWRALASETQAALIAALERSDYSQSALEEALETSHCMSIFKQRYFNKWHNKKEAIVSEIQKYRQNEKNSLNDVSRFLADSKTSLKPLIEAFDSRFPGYIQRRRTLRAQIDEFNDDVKYCNDTASKVRTLSSPKCSKSIMEGRRQTLEAESESLGLLEYELVALRTKIEALTNISPDLNVAVEVFGDCTRAWRGIVAEQKDFSAGFVKTPTIVVSLIGRNRYGGHNLDGRSIQVVPDKSIRRGNFRYDADKDIIRINPGDKANAGAAARSFERLRKKYLAGSTSYKQRVNSRIRSALAQPVGPVKPMETALARRVSLSNKTRGFGSADTGFDRNIIGGRPVELSAADAQRYIRMAVDSESHVIVQKIDSGHRIVGLSNGKPLATETYTAADFQRAVEYAVDRAIRDFSIKKGNVVIGTDRSMSWGDMEAIRLAANARQNAVSKGGNRNFADVVRIGGDSGGSGKPPQGLAGKGTNGGKVGGKGRGTFSSRNDPPLGILAGLTRKGKRMLARTDANWRAATLESQKIVSRRNKGAVILKIKVPFLEKTPKDFVSSLRLKISAFFRRKPAPKDLETLSELTFKAFEKDITDSTVAARIRHIRQEYKKRVSENIELRFRLQEGVQDMHIVEFIREVGDYDRG